MSRPPRPPALRPAPGVPLLPRGGLVLRGAHRDLRPDPPRPRRPSERRRRVPADDDALAAARLDDDGRPPGGALPPPPRQPRRAGAARGGPDEAVAAPVPRPRLVLPARVLGRPADLPRGLRLEPGERVPQAPGRREARDHHLRRDPRVLPAHGPGAAGGARPGAGRRRALPQALRPRSRRDLAARVRLPAGPRGLPQGSRPPLQLPRVARPHGRPPAPELRGARPDRLAGRGRLLRPRHGVLPPGLERGVGLPGRLRLPGVLQGRGLGAPDGRPRGLPPRRGEEEPRDQVLPRDRAGHRPRPQAALRARVGDGEGGEPRRQLPPEPPAAGRAPRRRGRARADRGQPLRRRALRALVVRGAAVPRLPVPQDALRPGRGEAHHPLGVPRPLRRPRGLPAAHVHLGRPGLRRGVAQRLERLDLPAPRHGGRAHGRAGAAATSTRAGSRGEP